MDLRKITGVLATAAMIASGSALAVDRPDWTFVQGSYGIGDGGGSGASTNAWGVAGSIGFGDMWHIAADYNDGEVFGTDFDSYTIYAGVNPSVGDGTDLFFDVFFGNFDEDFAGSSDADLWGLQAGVRHMVTERLELNAVAHYADVDDTFGGSSFDDVGASIGAQFNWNSFSSGISVNLTDDPTIVNLNVRWSFDWL